MELKRTREAVPLLLWRESALSTNVELRELALQGIVATPHGTLFATTNQTAGRGRLGRDWVMPPDTAVAASLLIRGWSAGSARGLGGGSGGAWGADTLPASWLPLLAGSAVVHALQPLFGDGLRVGVKWPNDVHVRTEHDAESGRSGQKLCGILCEMLPDGSAIVGIGINLLIPEGELPTERAASLLTAGADVGAAVTLRDAAGHDLLDRVLGATVVELMRLTELAGRDPAAVRIRVARHSLTLGSEVRVHLPDERVVDGHARALADDGALVVDLPTGGQLTVSAGDVQHLR
jgi:BirA family biotin operon repressor/biotin-[acetyl-CoA-carboxylase] ligase